MAATLVALSASTSSWMRALSMAATTMVLRSPWPSSTQGTAAASLCWNRGGLLEPVPRCATTSWCICYKIGASSGKLHPAASSVVSNAVRRRKLQSCMPELQPATGGAAREGGRCLLMRSFCLTNF